MKMGSADRESREINLKVYRPADKVATLQKKKEEKSRMEIELIEAKKRKEEAREEAKKEKKDEKNEMKRRREEEKGPNKTNKKNAPLQLNFSSCIFTILLSSKLRTNNTKIFKHSTIIYRNFHNNMFHFQNFQSRRIILNVINY